MIVFRNKEHIYYYDIMKKINNLYLYNFCSSSKNEKQNFKFISKNETLANKLKILQCYSFTWKDKSLIKYIIIYRSMR